MAAPLVSPRLTVFQNMIAREGSALTVRFGGVRCTQLQLDMNPTFIRVQTAITAITYSRIRMRARGSA